MSTHEVVIATLHLPMPGHTFTHLVGAMVDALEGEGWKDVVLIPTPDAHRPQVAATPPHVPATSDATRALAEAITHRSPT